MAEQTTLLAPLGESMNYEMATLDSVLLKKELAVNMKDTVQKAEQVAKTVRSLAKALTNAEKAKSLAKMSSYLDKAVETAGKAETEMDEAEKASTPDPAKQELRVQAGVAEKADLLLEASKNAKGAISKAKTLAEEAQKLVTEAKEAKGSINDEIKKAVSDAKKAAELAEEITKDVALQAEVLGVPNFSENEFEVEYFLESLSTLLFNDILPKSDEENLLHALRKYTQDILVKINTKLNQDVNAIIHDKTFKAMEANWLGLNDLLQNTDWSADIMIDLFDVTKEELAEDFDNNAVDLTSSSFFKKVYVSEYDQYGGKPYGSILGLYEFENSIKDRRWLNTMGRVAAACHAPFISSVGPKFFGCKTIQELAEVKDIEALMNQPRYNKWNKYRDSEEAAYIGLTLPGFLLRSPYDPIDNPVDDLNFKEKNNNDHDDFLWGNPTILFARNMVRSFAETGWCQYLRGPKGGGLIEYLPSFTFKSNGLEEVKIPVELTIPDYRELKFANTGFIPLIYRKGTSDACFFSCQSIKKSKKFKDPQDSENSQLVTNLSYTFSITRIAHYIKCIMRDNIGSPADAAYINNTILNWLSQYVTTVMNPDDRTLRYYPFKAITAETFEREGMIGWYDCTVSILPHIQFEGLDVELRLDVRL